jgi:hypothetical protein
VEKNKVEATHEGLGRPMPGQKRCHGRLRHRGCTLRPMKKVSAARLAMLYYRSGQNLRIASSPTVKFVRTLCSKTFHAFTSVVAWLST